ncbi:acyltransferase [Adlercreutzia sp. ZJ154]|uniref:acyltransferase n=1 Tax=Adlercreutzia sp. ZJ154 TaxID=2709790 RepID=UPI001F154DB0|nr:acyltransferase [Adlercreutzia sp. ZJ154]
MSGYYFDDRIVGWKWAWLGLKGRRLGHNNGVPWPVSPLTVVNGANNILFNVNDLHIFQTPGCYWQASDAKISIGSGCYIAPNVGIITTNHDPADPSRHLPGKDVSIGDNSWVGMNSVILPGVVLGENTVVAAGAVVTKSFPEGRCTIGGVPAKVLSRR